MKKDVLSTEYEKNLVLRLMGMLDLISELVEGFIGGRLKDELDCKKRIPCAFCKNRDSCVMDFWDGAITVADVDRPLHEYKFRHR